MVVRSALVQDLGRAARHKDADTEPPTILVSKPLDFKLSTEDRKKGQKKGILRLPPDYPHIMKKPTALQLKKYPDEKIYPESEGDLEVYSKWSANMKVNKDKEDTYHCDYQNKEVYKNRFLLSSPPQAGKTGVYLNLGELIWSQLGEPAHTSPGFEDVPLVEIETDRSDHEDLDPDLNVSTELLSQYPNPQHIADLQFKKPGKNIKYGTASDEELHDWYIVQHKQNPHPSAYTPPGGSWVTSGVDQSSRVSSQGGLDTNFKEKRAELHYNKSAAKNLEKYSEFDHSKSGEIYFRCCQESI